MKHVYVAGPFSAKDRAGVELNIQAAVRVGLAVARAGGFPVIPHANTAHPDFETLQPYTFWIEGTMRQLDGCDALVTVDGWERSSGAKAEVKRAGERGQPVFHDIPALADWLAAP